MVSIAFALSREFFFSYYDDVGHIEDDNKDDNVLCISKAIENKALKHEVQ